MSAGLDNLAACRATCRDSILDYLDNRMLVEGARNTGVLQVVNALLDLSNERRSHGVELSVRKV